MALRRLTVESWDIMIRSLQESQKRQRRILEETTSKLETAMEMREQSSRESAQADLVSQASVKKS